VIRRESAPKTSALPGATQGDTINGEPVLKPGSAFQSEFSDTGTSVIVPTLRSDTRRANSGEADTELVLNPLIKDSTYLKLKAQQYRLSFKPDYFTARLDNTVLFTQYQSAALNPDPGSYSNPTLGGLLSISLNDALENHKFTGGIRLPVNFSGMTYFLQYQNFTNRVDWGILYLRSAAFHDYNVSFSDSAGNSLINQQRGKLTSNLLQGSASYPLDRRRRIGMTLGLRQDVLDFKSEDTFSLTYSPRTADYWIMSRLEYVFDNSIVPANNIREGFRYKFYAEYLYGLDERNKGGFFNLGADFRYYKKLYRNSIFALRLATAHSEGDKHVLYYLGGVDGWLGPKNANTPPSSDQNYAFQALVTPLRGYKQNARNGNSYAVANLEVRIPVLQTFWLRPIQSTFLRHLQLIGFTDVGSAWNGIVPNSTNTTRNYYITAPHTPVSLNISRFENGGLAVGYGTGLRSSLLGYFVRVDAAWNIEGIKKPIWYVALGLDF
jgi:outer membrane protein assembly factor BamA